MELKRSGSQPSGKGPEEYFTGNVRIDPMASDTTDADEWLKKWSSAFDVEKVTERFFESYREVFEAVEKEVKKTIRETVELWKTRGRRTYITNRESLESSRPIFEKHRATTAP
jgi:hypothetical protein